MSKTKKLSSVGGSGGVLTHPVVPGMRWTWEHLIWAVILVLAVVSRFYDLGTRTQSHDESLHALFSWNLYAGRGYAHDPMMHGPFLFHITAFFYFLFGVSDAVSRISPALFGVALVMSPLLMRRDLGRVGAIAAGVLFLISPTTLYYSRYIRNDIYMAVWAALMSAALFGYWRTDRREWIYVGVLAIFFSLCTKETALITGFIGFVFLLLIAAVAGARRVVSVRASYLFSLIPFLLGVFTLILTQSSIPALDALWEPLVLVGALLLGLGLTWLFFPQKLPSVRPAITLLFEHVWTVLLACLIGLLIFVLLYTTFFTNIGGLSSGTIGAVRYWLSQQGVKRGQQPWFYYFMLAALYEFLPFLLSLLAMGVYFFTGKLRSWHDLAEKTSEPSDEPTYPFVAWLVWWTISAWIIYTWAGEKMPWMLIHPVQPMILLAARFIDDLTAGVDWRRAWSRGLPYLALLVPISLWAFSRLFVLRPFQGQSLFDLGDTAIWLFVFVMLIILFVAVGYLIVRMGWKPAGRTVFFSLIVILALLTVRFAWMAAYINYDTAKEFIVYAHGAPDVKRTVNELKEISLRLYGDETSIRFIYTTDATWPFEWYFHEFPNRWFVGKEIPATKPADPPVALIVGQQEWGNVPTWVQNEYIRFERIQVWWPHQDYYMGLVLRPQPGEKIDSLQAFLYPLKQVWTDLQDEGNRRTLWNVFFYRQYDQQLGDWEPAHRFAFYLSRDVAAKLWDYAAGPVKGAYDEADQPVTVLARWGDGQGSAPGQFYAPRDLAVAPDGTVYVVDSRNNRIQQFTADGELVRTWGSLCNLYGQMVGCVDPDGDGPLAPGDGQFMEPWGIAVDRDGYVYVADTWNHRVQKFTAEGEFVTKWGTYGMVAGMQEEPGVFWGPRDVAVDDQGRVYVTDTGNKRVQVFTTDGEFLALWGGYGSDPGQMDEPVGIALAPDGTLYVADTWNQRVQHFTQDGVHLGHWPVDAWYTQSLDDKPYLAVFGDRIYLTDPEQHRILVFDSEGKIVALLWHAPNTEEEVFGLPIGVDVAPDGTWYVADAGRHQVLKLAPLP